MNGQTIPRYVTVEWLKKHMACTEQCRVFARLFPKRLYPKGVRVSRKALMAVAGRLDLFWFASVVLPHQIYFKKVRPVFQAWYAKPRPHVKTAGEYTRAVARASAPMADVLWPLIKDRIR